MDCGYWPLYRYDPRRAEKGENPFQLDFKKLKSKVADYLGGENRYTSLERSQPEVAKKLHEELQKQIDIRHAERVRMAMSDKQLYKELYKQSNSDRVSDSRLRFGWMQPLPALPESASATLRRLRRSWMRTPGASSSCAGSSR